MAIRHFVSGTYRCVDCDKLTRAVIGGEAEVGLCHECYELAEWENYLADGGDEEDVPWKILKALKDRGANPVNLD